MSALVSKSFSLPSASKFEEQGIVSILGSDMDLITKIPPSLRRTISADMSSKKWLAQNGFSPMKKISSFGNLIADHSSDDYEDHKDELNMPGQDDVWRSIQLQKEKNEVEKPSQLCVWSSILVEKTNEPNNDVLPLYVHPLVKRSSSTLSEKSLQICTESLGSETGSDGFSSYPPSEEGDREDAKEDAQQEEEEEDVQEQSVEELGVAKYSSYPSKKTPPRSFPPPLPSLPKGDGPSLYMNSHRKNGRLVLKAVSVPQHNNFQAERQDGRLLLTLINCPTSQESNQDDASVKLEELNDVSENLEVEKKGGTIDEYGHGEEEKEDEGIAREEDVEKQKGIKQMALAMEKSSSMMKRLMGLNNKVPTWSNKLNRAINLMEVDELTQVPQSLPSASFNAYEYFWRNNAKGASIINPITQKYTTLNENTIVLAKSNRIKEYEHQDMMVMRRSNKSDYLVPMIKGCKENRKPLIIWHQYCIATS